MAIDTLHAGWAATSERLFTVSPWAFVVLAFIVVLGLVLRELMRNTNITQAIAGTIIETRSIKTTVDEIRIDQVSSNFERKTQYLELTSRIGNLEADMTQIKCTRVSCSERERAPLKEDTINPGV